MESNSVLQPLLELKYDLAPEETFVSYAVTTQSTWEISSVITSHFLLFRVLIYLKYLYMQFTRITKQKKNKNICSRRKFAALQLIFEKTADS